MIFVVVGAVVLLVTLPFILGNPAPVALNIGAVAVLVWLIRQGAYRFMLGALVGFTLAATTVVPAMQSTATIGRPAALLALIVVVVSQTWKIKPVTSGASRVIFALLYLIATIAIISAIWSIDPFGSITQGAVLLGMVIAIHRSATRRWVDRTTLVGDLKVVMTITALVLAAGLFAHYVGLLPPTFSGRYQGLLNNPNMAAQISIVVTFLGWGLLRETRRYRYFVPIAVALVTILLSSSRAAILAVLVGVAFLLIRSGTRGVLIAGAGAVAGAVAVLALGTAWLDPIIGRFGEVAAGDTLSGRSFIWDAAMALIQERPIGYGWGSTATLFEGLINEGEVATSAHSIHNSYLQTAVEGGVLALVLTALIYVALFLRIGAFTIRRLDIPNPGGLPSGLAAAAVAGFVGQFSESGIYGVGQAYPYLYWIAVGGFLAIEASRRGVESAEENVRSMTEPTEVRAAREWQGRW